MFLRKIILKICSKFTGEDLCRSVIPIKLQNNFIEILLWHGCSPITLLHIFRARFYQNISRRLLLTVKCIVHEVVAGSSPVEVTSTSNIASIFSKEFHEIQATIECRFTLTRVRDMIRTYSQMHRTERNENTAQSYLVSLAKWLSVCLQTKWLWVQIQCYLY